MMMVVLLLPPMLQLMMTKVVLTLMKKFATNCDFVDFATVECYIIF